MIWMTLVMLNNSADQSQKFKYNLFGMITINYPQTLIFNKQIAFYPLLIYIHVFNYNLTLCNLICKRVLIFRNTMWQKIGFETRITKNLQFKKGE